jgi:hypothetical protein
MSRSPTLVPTCSPAALPPFTLVNHASRYRQHCYYCSQTLVCLLHTNTSILYSTLRFYMLPSPPPEFMSAVERFSLEQMLSMPHPDQDFESFNMDGSHLDAEYPSQMYARQAHQVAWYPVSSTSCTGDENLSTVRPLPFDIAASGINTVLQPLSYGPSGYNETIFSVAPNYPSPEHIPSTPALSQTDAMGDYSRPSSVFSSAENSHLDQHSFNGPARTLIHSSPYVEDIIFPDHNQYSHSHHSSPRTPHFSCPQGGYYEAQSMLQPQPISRREIAIAPQPIIGVKRRASEMSDAQTEENAPTRRRIRKRRQASNSDHLPKELKDEERLLLWCKDHETLSWKEVAAKMQQELGKELQVPCLQMRFKRLKEKMNKWAAIDVSFQLSFSG